MLDNFCLLSPDVLQIFNVLSAFFDLVLFWILLWVASDLKKNVFGGRLYALCRIARGTH